MSCRRPSPHGALLEAGSDRRFRILVNDLFTVASRMEIVRAHLGRRMGISGPQYSVLVAVAHLAGRARRQRRAVAQAHARVERVHRLRNRQDGAAGLLLKRPNPQDRRGVLLEPCAGRPPQDRSRRCRLRAINDLFFGALDASSFGALSAAAAALVQGSGKALHFSRGGKVDVEAAG